MYLLIKYFQREKNSFDLGLQLNLCYISIFMSLKIRYKLAVDLSVIFNKVLIIDLNLHIFITCKDSITFVHLTIKCIIRTKNSKQ